ncbi:MAG: kelch repeat-containing protein [bacterium]|nr:kelch repeat-containing protein [bacterium]
MTRSPSGQARRTCWRTLLPVLVGTGAGCLGPPATPPVAIVRRPAWLVPAGEARLASLAVRLASLPRRVSELPASWQSLRATLTNPDRLVAPLVRLADQAGGSEVSAVFDRLRPGDAYGLSVELYEGPGATGRLLATGYQGQVSLVPGTNTVVLTLASALTRLDPLTDTLVACGSLVSVTGRFTAPATVTFQPSGVTVPLDLLSTTQGTFQVPCTTTSGTITVTGAGGTSEARAIRIATYTPTLIRTFSRYYDQALLARSSPRLVLARHGAGVVLHGNQVLALGGATGPTVRATIEQALANADGTLVTFRTLARTLLVPREGAAWLDRGDRLWALGGTDGTNALASTESAPWQADDTPGAFVNGQALVQARAYPSAVIAGGYVYVLGGEQKGAPVATVERAPIDDLGNLTGPFALVPEVVLSTPRSRAMALYQGGRIWLMGGRGAAGPLASLESAAVAANGELGAFSPGTASLNAPREGASHLVLGTELLVMGGRTTGGSLLASTERAPLGGTGPGSFTPATGITLDTACEGAGLVLLGDQLHLVGGTGSAGDLTRVEFAPTNASGRLGPFGAGTTTFTPRSGNGAAVLGRNVHVFGGCGASLTSTGGCQSDAAILDSIQRAGLGADGTLGAFMTSGRLDVGRFNFAPAVLGTNMWVIAGGMPSSAPGNTPKVVVAPISAEGSIGTFVDAGRSVAQVSGASALALGLNVYAIGGTDNNGTVQACRAGTLDPSTFSLTSFGNDGPRLATARARAGVVVLGQHVIVIGGQSDRQGTPLATVERCAIDPVTDKLVGNFTQVAGGLQVARVAPALVVTGSRLYVIGGTGGHGWTALTSIESAPISADGTLGAFSIVPDNALGTARGFAAAAAAGNDLHLFGGLQSGQPLGTTERATWR